MRRRTPTSSSGPTRGGQTPVTDQVVVALTADDQPAHQPTSDDVVEDLSPAAVGLLGEVPPALSWQQPTARHTTGLVDMRIDDRYSAHPVPSTTT